MNRQSIPQNWVVTELENQTESFQNGIWGDDPIPGQTFPVIRSTEITYDNKIDLSGVRYRKIPQDKTGKYQLFEGDILLVGSSGSIDLIGRPALFKQPKDGKAYFFSNFMVRLRPKNTNSNFLYYILNTNNYSNFLKTLQQTSTGLRNLPKKEFLKFKILLPPLFEQRKIVEILSTIDEAIQKVEEITTKTERLKRGLMEELLTKGIGHKEFKNTEIGRIPKEWEVAKLGEIVEINKETKNPLIEFPDRKFLYIDIESVENGTGIIKEAKELLGKEAPSRARRVIHYNDVVMSTVRPYLKAFAIIPQEYDNKICSTGFAVLTCKDYLLPIFLLHTLFSREIINQFNKIMIGGQYPALNESQVAEIKIPLPQLQEQQEISEILSAVDKMLAQKRARKEKLMKIKKGLMEDLLTGKVRVKV